MEQNLFIRPTRRQVEALVCPANEIFFGGARGGGKTYCGILDFLQQLPILKGRARGIAFRRSFGELEDIIEKCNEILIPLGFVQNVGNNIYVHPSGATYKLRYLEKPTDAERYQGHSYSHIFFDEIGNYKLLTGLDFLKSTLRGFGIPPRIIATANPGGRAHKLIKARYPIEKPMQIEISAKGWSKVYVPSLFTDNHYLYKKDPNYISRAVENLPEFLRQAWEFGNWNISTEAGMYFEREDFRIERKIPECVQYVRCWDRAATTIGGKNTDPDYTAGVLMGKGVSGETYVIDVIKVRKRGYEVKELIKETALKDGLKTKILLFQDPGQAGKDQSEDMKIFLAGFILKTKRETGAKYMRWLPFSSAIQNGSCRLIEGKWNEDYIDELSLLTDSEKDYSHDDQADASAGAYTELNQVNLSDPFIFDPD